MNIQSSNLSIMNNTIAKEEIILDSHIKELKVNNKIGMAAKRGIDIVGSVIGIALLIPITLFLAICNFIAKENGPLFFKQARIGKDGRTFYMYKYRTMIVNAEDILKEHIKKQTKIGKEYVKNKKIKNDPRITKIGKFLRNTSLDEFPQFINVLKGEMSLVGPRPYLPMEKEDMGDTYKVIIQMKPGLTGPWQVAGRSNLGFNDRVALDEKYYEEKSLAKDIKMVLKTFTRIIQKEGAM